MNHPASLLLEGAVAQACCNILDLSLKGVQLAFPLKLDRDKFVRMRLILASDIHLNFEAWVAWHKIPREGVNTYGLYFTKISDSDKEKIYQFICRFYPSHIKQQICEIVPSNTWPYRTGQCALSGQGGEIMEEKKSQDRRIFDRFPTRMPLRFLDAGANLEGIAETCDVSAKGIGFLSSQQIAPRSPLEVWLEIPDKGEPLYARGEVAWSKYLEPNKYRIGINLERADLMGLSRVMRAA